MRLKRKQITVLVTLLLLVGTGVVLVYWPHLNPRNRPIMVLKDAHYPHWSPDGNTLFFFEVSDVDKEALGTLTNSISSYDMKTGKITKYTVPGIEALPWYSISPKGQRFFGHGIQMNVRGGRSQLRKYRKVKYGLYPLRAGELPLLWCGCHQARYCSLTMRNTLT